MEAAYNSSTTASSETSVVICNYNYERFIASAIDSVLAQSVAPCQLIIVDDGSTDGSRAIIDRYSEHGIVKVFKENGGQCSAYNVGLEHVTGKYVIFLDSDDRLLPTAIEKVEKSFAPGVSKVHYPLELIDANGKRLGTRIPILCDSGDVKSLILSGYEYLSPPASGNAYLASALRKAFPIPLHPTERYPADFFAIFAAPFFGSVVTVAEAQGEYRTHLSRGQTIGFGNAGSAVGSQQRNVDILASWLSPIVGEQLPPKLLNFSVLKVAYAQTAVSADGFATRFTSCLRMLPSMLKSLWRREGMSIPTRSVLTMWAILLPLMPRPVALKAAIYVCNPDSR